MLSIVLSITSGGIIDNKKGLNPSLSAKSQRLPMPGRAGQDNGRENRGTPSPGTPACWSLQLHYIYIYPVGPFEDLLVHETKHSCIGTREQQRHIAVSILCTVGRSQ